MIFWFYISIDINPYTRNISFILLIGIAIVLLSFFSFLNLNHKEGNLLQFEIKFLSEDLIKAILVVSMGILIIITPISSTSTIIIWEKVGFLNYFRAIGIVMGCTIVPGASIYNIFFSKDNTLPEQFKVNPFILKITLYPLISLSLIGFSVLILSQIGLKGDMITIFLFIIILVIFFIDLIIQKIRSIKLEIKFVTIKISKNTFIILILAIGILLISLGVNLGDKYLIPGDSWAGVSPAYYIGRPELNPFYDRDYAGTYPIFWGYIIYGLSAMTGLPYINVNVMLAPFCFIFITSIYLFMKAILCDFKEKYIILSTLLTSIFSGYLLYIESFNDVVQSVPNLILVCEYYFIYKTFAYFLYFTALALFINIINKGIKNRTELQVKEFSKMKLFKYFILVAFFLVISYITYTYTLLMGLSFIFLYCLFSGKGKKPQYFKFYAYLIFLIISLLIIFDLIMNFYPSFVIIEQISKFFKFGFLNNTIEIVPFILLFYAILIGFFFFCIIIQRILNKMNKVKFKIKFKIKKDSKKVFKFFLLIFNIFLIIYIIGIIVDLIIVDINLGENFFFFLYLNKIFLNIGIIGIIAVNLSFFSFRIRKKKKKIYFLIIWILFSFILGSILIYLRWIENIHGSPMDLSKNIYVDMINWFDRIWFYSIPPLCVLASIGIFKVVKKFKNHKYFKNKRILKPTLKYTSFLILILLSYSSIVVFGMWVGTSSVRANDDEIQTIGWMSENIPQDSNILIEKNYHIMHGIRTLTFGNSYYIDDIFNNESEYIQQIYYLKDNNIRYMLISQSGINQSSNLFLFINNTLIPNFYNVTLFKTGEVSIYYAPYTE